MTYISEYMSNVDLGIDLDTKNQFKLLKTYFNAKWLAEHINKKSKVEVYETLHGYHIRVIGLKTNVHYRLGLCDDPERIYYGEKRTMFKSANDVLFDTKVLRKGRNKIYVSKEEEFNVYSLPFWWWYNVRNKVCFRRRRCNKCKKNIVRNKKRR